MKNLFSYPHFVDAPNKNRVARLLHILLWSLILATVVYIGGLALFLAPLSSLALSLTITPIPISICLLTLLHRGHVQLTSMILVWFIWAVMAGSSLVAGGIYAPGYVGLVIPIVLSGVVLGKESLFTLAILSALAGYALLVAGRNGWIEQLVVNSDESIWLSNAFFFVVVAVLGYLTIDTRERMLSDVEGSRESLLESNRDLEAEIETRIQAEAELRYQANILAHVNDAIIVTSVEQEIQYWNRGAELLYGIPSTEVIGQQIDSVLDYSFVPGRKEERENMLLSQGYWRGEDRTVVRESGKEVRVESNVQLLFNDPPMIIVAARDIQARLEAEEALAYRSKFQELVTELAIYFVNLPAANMNDGFSQALAKLGAFLNVDRGVITLIDNENQVMNVISSFTSPSSGVADFKPSGVPLAEHQWLLNQLEQSEVVHIPDVNKLPDEMAFVRSFLKAVSTRSIIDVPLMHNETLIGFLGFSMFNQPREWTSYTINQLLVLAQLIVNAHENRAYKEHLQQQAQRLDSLAIRLTSIHDLDQAIFSSRSLPEIFPLALSNLQNLTGCKCCSIFLIEDEGRGRFVAQNSDQAPLDLEQSVSLDSLDYIDDLRDGMLLLNHNLREYDPSSSNYKMGQRMGVESSAHVPLMARSTLIGILHLGFAEPESVSKLNVDTVESVASSLSLAIANTQLYEQVQHQASELEQKVAIRTAALEQQYSRQAALAEIELAINEPAELQNVLDQIVQVTSRTLPADIGVSVILWQPLEQSYFTSATSVVGQKAGQVAQRVRKEGGATRWILDHARQLIVTDTREDPFGANSMLIEHGVGSYAGLPMIIEGQTIGVLYSLHSQPRDFTEEEIEFLAMVASRAAVAVTKVRLFEQAQTMAASEERQRIARELHDGVTQSLFSASVIAESLPRLLGSRPEMVSSGLHDLNYLTKGTLAEMRSLLFELRPDGLAETELRELFQKLADGFTGRTRIPVSLTVTEDIDLPPSQHIGLYRIVQEALNNIWRHAQAKHVYVTLDNDSREYRLTIRDDGVGFDSRNVESGHFGLQIMHERAEEMGAQLVIDSTPNVGTSLTLTRRYSEAIY